MDQPPEKQLRFSPDHGFYLWDVWGTVPPEDLGVSESLIHDLEEWYAFWRAHTTFDDDGWDSPESREWYAEQSSRLLARLRAECPDHEILDEHDWCL